MRTPLVIAAMLLGPALVALTACGNGSTPSNAPALTGALREDVYTGIRGVVTMLPVEGNPASELKIQHEQIPTFLNKDGEIPVNMRGVPGMASMTMPFPVAEGLDISSMSIGDKVAFNFTVYWGRADGGPAWEITRFEKLDPATELDFTNTTVEDAATDAPDATDAPGEPNAEDHSIQDNP